MRSVSRSEGECAIEKWLRDDPKNTKYVLKMDIRHFFDEVPHDILKSKLAKVIHDEKMLYLLDQIINVSSIKGLANSASQK